MRPTPQLRIILTLHGKAVPVNSRGSSRGWGQRGTDGVPGNISVAARIGAGVPGSPSPLRGEALRRIRFRGCRFAPLPPRRPTATSCSGFAVEGGLSCCNGFAVEGGLGGALSDVSVGVSSRIGLSGSWGGSTVFVRVSFLHGASELLWRQWEAISLITQANEKAPLACEGERPWRESRKGSSPTLARGACWSSEKISCPARG